MQSSTPYNTHLSQVLKLFFQTKPLFGDGYLWPERMDVCDDKTGSGSAE